MGRVARKAAFLILINKLLYGSGKSSLIMICFAEESGYAAIIVKKHNKYRDTVAGLENKSSRNACRQQEII
jgi:hypothetical protein